MKTKERTRRKTKRPANRPSQSQVVYTQPQAVNRRKLLWRLGGVAGIVLALILGLAIFFQVGSVDWPQADGSTLPGPAVYVSGNEKYTQAQVVEASGIREGDNLMTLSKARISGKIIKELPYVDTVRIRISLPDTVRIEITELDALYAVSDFQGLTWLISASGRVVSQTNDPGEYPFLEGVRLDTPIVGNQAVAAAEPVPTGEETQAVLVAPAERLDAALAIFQAMEEVGMLTGVKTVDVSLINYIMMNYDDRFTVELGDRTGLAQKVSDTYNAIGQLHSYDTGTLDVSYRVRPNEVVFTSADDET